MRMTILFIVLSINFFSCQEQRMNTPNQPYTLGLWTVKEGKEDDFIAEWEGFAKWTSRNQHGARDAYLLRDLNNPRLFISFGPWDDAEAIATWRGRPEFKAFVAKAKELCDDFQPRSLVLAAAAVK